jgi:hypothetical protein
MGTRSRIGIQLSDDSILSVYHHWDGYPTWLGKVLNTHYSSKEKVEELIDGGDMSVCWTDETFRDENGKTHKKDQYGPQYYSERGEDCPPRYDENIFDFLSKENNEEYAYIWTVNNKWVCTNMNQFDDDKQPEKVEIPSGALAV